MATTELTFNARWVIPISQPPIENGFVVVSGGQIVRVGKRGKAIASANSAARDLGDVAILPGLVNAHTHLEFSDLSQPIGVPGMELAQWIGEVIRSRRETSGTGDERTQRRQAALTAGAIEASDSGTALMGEIATTPWSGVSPQAAKHMQIVAFAEVLGLSAARADERLQAAEIHLALHPLACGISPHAPYSTPPELISRCVQLAIKTNCPLAMHVAESPAERDLLAHGSGPFADSLQALGLNISASFPWPHREPLLWLIDLLAQAPAGMLIHGNDLRADEINRIASHSSLSVIYCPRTQAYFGHARHPVADLLAAGINVALGTDSRASNPDLQLWREVRFLLNHRQDLTPASVLKMATLGGAVALRRTDSHGSLQPGRAAAFTVVSTSARDLPSLYGDLASGDASSADASSADALHN